MISLGAGAPSAAYFPFNELQVKLSEHPGIQMEKEQKSKMIRMSKYDFEPGVSDYRRKMTKRGLLGLDVALNYGQGTGSVQMLRFVTEHTELLHQPPYDDWGCCLTVGSTSAWDSTLRMFCEKGDYIVVEDYTFASALETAWPLGVKTVSVAMDEQGLIPESLDTLLSEWDETQQQARKPFLLYMVPTGQNPTGATQSIGRRKEIYSLAQKHDLYIVEDEPYYYLQLPPFTSSNPGQPCPLIPSYLSIDVEGRVLRMDSLSKVLAPGARMGWVTASQQVIEKFIRQNETSSQHPSGFSQVIVYKLLSHHWGHLGFFQWLEAIQSEYAWRRDTFIQSCEKFLPKQFTHWNVALAGMFQWIEINWRLHPSYKAGGSHQKIEQAIFGAAKKEKVFLTPGTCFWSASEEPQDQMFFRATYASASRDELTEAVRRFGVALRNEFARDVLPGE
ncbi:hypothetical protein N7462_004540 [Penicillium macrosclerotiorum]|uniref:uncharacterized protein n=1 Tax=Penicillium macrosclerotiorum TaxID=303699 RepID=UPI002547DD38|nr:uncharacterized protein N7462_004540 [Penicillium macrosclerotiorum]KAJ5690148.1 hypothetical protein N7462_004540 [Penicillium macrosclerotiorum]